MSEPMTDERLAELEWIAAAKVRQRSTVDAAYVIELVAEIRKQRVGVRRWVEMHRDEYVPRADVDVRERQWRAYEGTLIAERDEARVRVSELETAVNRVKALHRRDMYGDLDYCVICVHKEGAFWPCETVKTLDGSKNETQKQ